MATFIITCPRCGISKIGSATKTFRGRAVCAECEKLDMTSEGAKLLSKKRPPPENMSP